MQWWQRNIKLVRASMTKEQAFEVYRRMKIKQLPRLALFQVPVDEQPVVLQALDDITAVHNRLYDLELQYERMGRRYTSELYRDMNIAFRAMRNMDIKILHTYGYVSPVFSRGKK